MIYGGEVRQEVSGEGKERIGLFGGTFDPVHAGHLAIAGQAAQELRLDRIIFIPAADPPHKKKPGASYGHRVAMLEAAFTEQAVIEQSRFAISLLEAELSAPSYTVDTLLELKKRLPGHSSFYFLIGADSLLELHLWYRYQDLLRLTNFIVVSRPGIPIPTMRQAIAQLPGPFLPGTSCQHWLRADGTEFMLLINQVRKNISSSMIRRQLREGEQPDSLSGSVLEYIDRHQLYPA